MAIHPDAEFVQLPVESRAAESRAAWAPPSAPLSGAGIGLRAPHYRDLHALSTAHPGRPQFLEVHSENFFGLGGQPWAYLERFRASYPISVHGVGMSLGSAGSIDARHVAALKRVVERIEPVLVSDHLCWVGVDGRYLNDLLPVPYTRAALQTVVENVDALQTALGRRILLENVSSYLEFEAAEIPEWEFIAEVASRSGCRLLLDVNNIYVNSQNHHFDAERYLNSVEPSTVGEIHLAGHQDVGDMLIDTHGDHVSDAVWALYATALHRFGPVPTLVEWDTDIPPLETLLAEAARARAMQASHVARIEAVELGGHAE
jgi:uncharacterized protein (UPF0276 family)